MMLKYGAAVGRTGTWCIAAIKLQALVLQGHFSERVPGLVVAGHSDGQSHMAMHCRPGSCSWIEMRVRVIVCDALAQPSCARNSLRAASTALHMYIPCHLLTSCGQGVHFV